MSTLKHILLGLLSICLLLSITQVTDAQGILQESTVHSSSLEGNLLGDPASRSLIVYLPPGYDTSDERYPVVYLLHTGGATERFFPYNEFPPSFEATGMFIKPQDFPETGFASLIDSLINVGDIQPMIIAMPNINTAYGGSFGINSALNGNYEDYIVQDIVSYVDSNFRTLAKSENRAIAGHCMGGFGAMYLSMKHPEVFGLVASHSSEFCIDALARASQPMLKAENPDGIGGPDPAKPFTSFMYLFSAAYSPNLANPPYYIDIPFDDTCAIREDILEKWAMYDPIQLFPSHVPALMGMKGIYLDVGDKDELQSSYFMLPFSEALNTVGIAHSFELFDGMHYANLYTRLSKSLTFLSESMKQSPTAVEDGVLSELIPKKGLVKNFPNPFYQSTTIKYAIQEGGLVSLKIYNLHGQELETILQKDQSAGKYEVIWHPENLQEGIYVVELRINNISVTEKLICLK